MIISLMPVYLITPEIMKHFSNSKRVLVIDLILISAIGLLFFFNHRSIIRDVTDEYEANPHADNLLEQIWTLGSEECSPENDLDYARKIRALICEDSFYNGNVDQALTDVAETSERITDSGSQQDINTWTDILRLLASIRTSLSYDTILSVVPDNELVYGEYVAWHNLMETMAYYLDFTYSAASYRAVPEDKNCRIIYWLNYRREALEKERDILTGELFYVISESMTDSLKQDSDFQAFFHKYYSESYPNSMWSEVRPAFYDWCAARNKLAEQLAPRASQSYREYTKEIIDRMFSFIEGLRYM